MSAPEQGTAFRLESLSHAYPDGRRALRGVGLVGRLGEVLGLMGPNGSGKSTLIRVVAGVLEPDEGRVRRPRGAEEGRSGPGGARAARGRRAAVFDRSPLADELPARANVTRLLELRGMARAEAGERADAWLDRFGLAGRRSDRVGGFSQGMRRKTDLAAAFASRAELLLLDEPLEGLDAAARATLGRALEEHAGAGGTAVVTGHEAGFMERACGRVAFLRRGRVVARGAPAELIRGVEAETTVEVELDDGADLPDGRLAPAGAPADRGDAAPWPTGVRPLGRDGRTLRFACSDGGASLPELCRALQDGGGAIAGLRVRRPDLDDAYWARAGERRGDDP